MKLQHLLSAASVGTLVLTGCMTVHPGRRPDAPGFARPAPANAGTVTSMTVAARPKTPATQPGVAAVEMQPAPGVAQPPAPPPPEKTEEQVFAEGVAAFEAGHYDEARAAFIEALRKAPDDVNAQYDLGVVAERQGELPKAQAAYESAHKLDSAHLPTLLNLGRVYRLQDQTDRAIALYEEALRLPGREYDTALLNNLAVAYRLNKLYGKAEATARKVLARTPDNAEAYKNLALVYYDEGNYRLAEFISANARKLDDKDPGIYNNLGLIYLKLSDPARALAQFQKALALDDKFAPGYLNVGAMALSHRDYENAERAFAKAMELDPTSYEARLYYAWALDGQKGRDAKKGLAAGEAFEKVLESRPDRSEAICGAGWAYAADRAGWDKAVAFLEKCKALRQDSPQDQQLIDMKLKGIAAMQKSPPPSPPQMAKPAPEAPANAGMIDKVSDDAARQEGGAPANDEGQATGGSGAPAQDSPQPGVGAGDQAAPAPAPAPAPEDRPGN